MADILVYPDKRLEKFCPEFEDFGSSARLLEKELVETLRAHNATTKDPRWKGCALAAPQIGELQRMFVIDTEGLRVTCINPVVTKTSGTKRTWELCLSLPGRAFLVERPKVVKIHYQDVDGNQKSLKAHDLIAQALIHESEHLRGIMLTDIKIQEQQV